MFSRALLVALCIVYATSLTPLAPLSATADDDCALYLTGPGRSSAYDYSLNLLKGNFAYDGQHTCITYEAINQAYLDARNRILVAQPKGDWKAEDFASVGELILDISISLARTYGLTYEEIEKGLPLIDTSRTLIREVCPPVFSHVECRAGKYRRLDGLCNNLKHPTWGATMAPFQRLIGPLFSDGINAPRISHSGHDLPLSRVVSRTMHPDDGFHDHAGTVMVIAWGQFMDHDYTLTGTPLDPVHRNDPEECCKRPLHLKHPYCNEIIVPGDDYFYRLFGVKCIDFVRGFPSPRPGCRLGSRIPFNTLTGAIDGNTVYGVTEKFARKLRTGYGGLLRMNPVFKEYGLKDLLPLKLDIPDEGCTRPNKNMYCFEAGEIRVNEQLVLTVMHTLMAREHNRVAEALAHVNPHWDDESLFQEARRINIAEIQHITYNEFLPILLGKDVMEKFGLVLAKEGYWEGYDEEVNPDVIASFAAAAYRFGHSLLPTAVERWSKAHKFIASKRLSDLIRRPYDLYRAGVLDEYVMGLMNQVAQAMDDSITQEVTNHLFKKVGARFGMDLVSFNMQRGREFGLPGYMEFRKFCGLSGADTFQDLFGSMANETIRKYESIFEHPIDVDLWSGGVSERPLPGSMLGPTFACVIATQFSYSRRGDRFWFELPNQPSSFTQEQLAEIRKSRLARIICDNTDIIDTVQLYPMVLPDHELNPRVPCRSGIIPSMDFSKWADPVPFLGGAKEYMTDAYTFNGTATQNNQADKICNNSNETCASNKILNTNSQNNDNSKDFNILIKDKEINNLCLHPTKNTDCLDAVINNNTNEASNIGKDLANQLREKTTLKYVNKKDINVKASEKLKGHFKNSLKRKRRSFNRNIEDNGKTIAHGIYDVIKDQNIERGELNLPKFNPSDIIKPSDIADFKVETLHNRNKPDQNQLERGEQKYYDHNNDQYFPNSKERGNTNNENTSYRDDKYKTLIKDENLHESQRRFNPSLQKEIQGYHDDINSKHNSPKTRELTEKSEEINAREDSNQENSSDEDLNDNRSNENNKMVERLRDNVKPPNNILSRGNIRYYKDKKNKYHISKPKPLNSASHENYDNDDSSENINKNNPSLEEEDDDVQGRKFVDSEELDGNRSKPFSPSHKEEIKNENVKQTDKDRFTFSQEDESDEDSGESYKRNESLRGHKQQPENNLHRHSERYYNNRRNPVSAPKTVADYSDETDETEDEDEYADDEDDEPLENFKQDGRIYSNKPSSDDILEKHNQQYNDNRNEYFSSAVKNQDESRKENYSKDNEDEEGDPNENFSNNRDTSKPNKQPKNILLSHNKIYYNNGNNSPGHQGLVKERDESNESQGSHKENQYQDNDEVDERGIPQNKQTFNKLQTQNQLYHNDNNNNPLLQSDNPNNARNVNYGRQSAKIVNEYEDEDKKLIENYNKNKDVSTHIAQKPVYSYSPTDSERENSNQKDGSLKYTNQPKIHRNSEKSGRPIDIPIQTNIKSKKPHLLTDDRSFYGKNTNDERNSKENFSDSRRKETQISNEDYKISPKEQDTYDKSKALENDDLSNFSYDKFRGDLNRGNLDPDKASHENYESDSLDQITTTIKPKIKKSHKGIHSNIKKPTKFNKQVHINRDVGKPVKELTNENSNEEAKKNSNENLNGNYDSILPNRGNYRKVDSTKTNGKANIKQQFPRISSDYIHVGSDKTKSRYSAKNTESEGTLDTLSPKNDNYDENLKIKFGNVNIKLPEIKLPEDILAYTQEVPENNKDKTNYYNYHNEDAAQYTQKPRGNPENIHHYNPTDTTVYSQQLKPKGDKTPEEYDFFASYINKPHEETKTDDANSKSVVEDGEDLYERFVRERFGRKDSFKERSEKLQEKKKKLQENKPTTKNKELFANIQKAIKKAEEVQKQAENSKDPKANYLWTLEYGEKL